MAQCQHQDIDWSAPLRPTYEKNAPVPMKQCTGEALPGEVYCKDHLEDTSGDLVGS